jgi:hypothetical protein
MYYYQHYETTYPSTKEGERSQQAPITPNVSNEAPITSRFANKASVTSLPRQKANCAGDCEAIFFEVAKISGTLGPDCSSSCSDAE